MVKGITGAHWLMYSKDAEADRIFLRDVFGLRAVDAGEGWLILALPPSELGVHPSESNFVLGHGDQKLFGAVLYLMCDDIKAAVKSLKEHRIKHTPVAKAGWGRFTVLQLPSGGGIGLYQPAHPRAV